MTNQNPIRVQKIYGTDERIHEEALNDKKYTRGWEILDINYSEKTNITTYYWKRKTYEEDYKINTSGQTIDEQRKNNSILKKSTNVYNNDRKEKPFSFSSSSSEGDE